MNYTPRYTYWLFKANIKTNQLPIELAGLISQYEIAVGKWQDSTESEQQLYRKIVENIDAFISAKIYTLFENKINEQSESDKLKDLLSKAADLDF